MWILEAMDVDETALGQGLQRNWNPWEERRGLSTQL